MISKWQDLSRQRHQKYKRTKVDDIKVAKLVQAKTSKVQKYKSTGIYQSCKTCSGKDIKSKKYKSTGIYKSCKTCLGKYKSTQAEYIKAAKLVWAKTSKYKSTKAQEYIKAAKLVLAKTSKYKSTKAQEYIKAAKLVQASTKVQKQNISKRQNLSRQRHQKLKSTKAEYIKAAKLV